MSSQVVSILVASLLLPAPSLAAGIIDPSKPLHVVATEVIVDEPAATTVYRGNVTIRQRATLILGDEVIVRRDDPKGESYEVIGQPARVEHRPKGEQKPVVGRSTKMVYWLDEERLQLHGNAQLDRGEDRLRGERIGYVLPTDRAFVESGDGDRRVRAVYDPAERPPP